MPELAAEVATLAEAEQDCCAFFDCPCTPGSRRAGVDRACPDTAAVLLADLFGSERRSTPNPRTSRERRGPWNWYRLCLDTFAPTEEWLRGAESLTEGVVGGVDLGDFRC